MNSFIDKITSSLDTHSKGFSARKLSALAVMGLVVSAQVVWIVHAFKREDFNLLIEVSIIDFGFILSCLGLTTWEKVKSKTPPDEPKAE